MAKISSITFAAVVATLPLAGCTTDPNVTVGKAEFTVYRGFGENPGPRVSPNDPRLLPVRKGCRAYYTSRYNTEQNLYGIYGADYAGLFDEAKDCFRRHGYNLAWRQPNGKLTPYPYYDHRLDY